MTIAVTQWAIMALVDVMFSYTGMAMDWTDNWLDQHVGSHIPEWKGAIHTLLSDLALTFK